MSYLNLGNHLGVPKLSLPHLFKKSFLYTLDYKTIKCPNFWILNYEDLICLDKIA